MNKKIIGIIAVVFVATLILCMSISIGESPHFPWGDSDVEAEMTLETYAVLSDGTRVLVTGGTLLDTIMYNDMYIEGFETVPVVSFTAATQVESVNIYTDNTNKIGFEYILTDTASGHSETLTDLWIHSSTTNIIKDDDLKPLMQTNNPNDWAYTYANLDSWTDNGMFYGSATLEVYPAPGSSFRYDAVLTDGTVFPEKTVDFPTDLPHQFFDILVGDDDVQFSWDYMTGTQ